MRGVPEHKSCLNRATPNRPSSTPVIPIHHLFLIGVQEQEPVGKNVLLLNNTFNMVAVELFFGKEISTTSTPPNRLDKGVA